MDIWIQPNKNSLILIEGKVVCLNSTTALSRCYCQIAATATLNHHSIREFEQTAIFAIDNTDLITLGPKSHSGTLSV
jgi:hypothetical protein